MKNGHGRKANSWTSYLMQAQQILIGRMGLKTISDEKEMKENSGK